MVRWVALAGIGLGIFGLCVRYMMIQSAMVRELMASDPAFQPKSPWFTFDQDKKSYNVREYRARMPDSPLSAKLRTVEWALAAFVALAAIWMFTLPPH